MSREDDAGVLPNGVSLCPKVREYLQRALRCLDAGLVVGAWSWTEKARRALDELTDGPEQVTED